MGLVARVATRPSYVHSHYEKYDKDPANASKHKKSNPSGQGPRAGWISGDERGRSGMREYNSL